MEPDASQKGIHDHYHIPSLMNAGVMERFLGLFSLFPHSCEFYKDDLIQLWMAQIFVPIYGYELQRIENNQKRFQPELTRLGSVESRSVDIETMKLKLTMKENTDSIIKILETVQKRLLKVRTETEITESKRTRMFIKTKTEMEVMMEAIQCGWMGINSLKEELEMMEKIETKIGWIDIKNMELKLDMMKKTQLKIGNMSSHIHHLERKVDVGGRAKYMRQELLRRSSRMDSGMHAEIMNKLEMMEYPQLADIQDMVMKGRQGCRVSLDTALEWMERRQDTKMDSEMVKAPSITEVRTGTEIMEMKLEMGQKMEIIETELQKMRSIHRWIYTETVCINNIKVLIEVYIMFFDHLERIQLLVMADLKYMTPLPKYKVNHGHPLWFPDKQFDHYIKAEGGRSNISRNTYHCSIGNVTIDPTALKQLYKAKGLNTLIIQHDDRGSRLDHVPRELFLYLSYLNALDLSRTNITELPSSIGNLFFLRYINLSGTLITTLPYSLFGLRSMQTLKLRDCLKLVCLPNDTTNFTNLLHLDVDVACLLASMPPGIGNLTQLRALPAFVVGKENGCRITELKNMMYLCGTLSIFRLENISSSEEPKIAALDKKKDLKKLELQWTESQDGSKILKNLRPPTGIEELQIVGYGGAKFSSWIGDPVFSTLTIITIHDCRRCEVLPPLGRLPCLEILSISEMSEVEVIDHQFYGRNMDKKGLDRLWVFASKFLSKNAFSDSMVNPEHAFPSLKSLTLDEMPKLEKWCYTKEDDFPRLEKLNISSCPKLTTLPELSILKSLKQVEISSCPLLQHFLTKPLPTSLESAVIIDCPLLKQWCNKEEEEDPGNLAHFTNLWIDYQQISQVPPA